MSFTITSGAFENNGLIPARFTCDGEDISPSLLWANAPKETRSLALVVDDPDAPDPKAPRMTWVHWVVYNISPTVHHILEGASTNGLPQDALQGMNDWRRLSYGGPCPPVGRHRYFFKLYALDTVFANLHRPTKMKLENAMKSHIIAQTQLIGMYQKQR